MGIHFASDCNWRMKVYYFQSLLKGQAQSGRNTFPGSGSRLLFHQTLCIVRKGSLLQQTLRQSRKNGAPWDFGIDHCGLQRSVTVTNIRMYYCFGKRLILLQVNVDDAVATITRQNGEDD